LLTGLIVLLSFSLSVLSFNKNNDIEFQSYKNGIYVVSIDSDYFEKNSDIYVSKSLETVHDAAVENKAKIAINAGFFDPNNTKTTSFIIKNNEIIASPEENEDLIQNEKIKPYLNKVFNRSEFRVLECPIDKILQNGELKSQAAIFEIKNHNESIPAKEYCTLKYSVQAGPQLVPGLKLEEEFFILKKDGKTVRESASVLHKVARSAIAIKKDRILLVAASNEAPMTLEELANFMKEIGAEKAMAFDGGSSTSLYLNKTLIGMASDKLTFNLTSAKDNSARRVKSILIVK